MYCFELFSRSFCRCLKLGVQLLYHSTGNEGCTSFKLQPSFFKQYLNFLLAEVPLQQVFYGLAETGFRTYRLPRVQLYCVTNSSSMSAVPSSIVYFGLHTIPVEVSAATKAQHFSSRMEISYYSQSKRYSNVSEYVIMETVMRNEAFSDNRS